MNAVFQVIKAPKTFRCAGIFLSSLLCFFPLAATSTENPAEPQFRTWIDVRDEGIVKQSLDYSCGPAAMATLLSYYFQTPTSEQEILNALEHNASFWKLPDDWRETGVSMAALAKIAVHSGLEAVGVAVELRMLRRLKAPAIVYLEHRGFPHFSVIRGVDSAGAVQLADPSWGNQLLSEGEFEALWPIGPTGKGKLLLLRPNEHSQIIVDSDYFTVSSRRPMLRSIY